jgi:hypothetical protein
MSAQLTPSTAPCLADFPPIRVGWAQASADDRERFVRDTGDVRRDTFEALTYFYALFGHPPAAIPLVVDGGDFRGTGESSRVLDEADAGMMGRIETVRQGRARSDERHAHRDSAEP